MPATERKLKTCLKGHRYYKSTDCLTCPVCEQQKKPKTGFLSVVSAPARRALISQNILTLQDLANWSEDELLELHGIGPKAIPPLRLALQEGGLKFR